MEYMEDRAHERSSTIDSRIYLLKFMVCRPDGIYDKIRIVPASNIYLSFAEHKNVSSSCKTFNYI